MIYNDVYTLMNDILRGNASVEINKKTRAYNEGARQLVERMAGISRAPGVLLERNYNITIVSGQNYVDLPSDFCKLQSIWKKSSSTWLLVQANTFELVTLEELMKIANSDFLNTSATSNIFSFVALDDDKMYFDKHFSSSGTGYLRIWYWKYPAEVSAVDTIAIESVSGTFTAGETITGGTSNASGTYSANTSSLMSLTSDSISGTFQSGETLTGGSSAATATTTGTLTEKNTTLELGDKYKLSLAEAGAAMFLHMIGSYEAQEKDNILDNLVKQLGSVNRGGTVRLRPGVA